MMTTRSVLCLAGSLALVGAALAGLDALSPLDGDPARPKYYLELGLLTVFWLAYVIFTVSLLVWLGRKLFGSGDERETDREIMED